MDKRQDQVVTVNNNFTSAWNKLFKTGDQKRLGCGISTKDNITKDDAEVTSNGRMPVPKTNKFDHRGKHAEAYLFDYLDDIFRKDVVEEFKKAYEAAQKTSPSANPDPYTMQTLLYGLSQGATGNINVNNNGQQTGGNAGGEGLGKFIKGFSLKDWEKYVTVPQLEALVQAWGYAAPAGDFKSLLDKYDYNGDGRLSPYEFLQLSILHNQQVLGTNTCKTNCYNKFVTEVLDPIFTFADCDNNGYINAEDLWEAVINLKRDSTKYDLFGCRLKSLKGSSKYVRTSATNAFILKNGIEKQGQVTLHEFRSGVLLGFLNRQVDEFGIKEKDELTEKPLRWDNDGKEDKECKAIENIAYYKAKSEAPKAVPANQ